MAERAGPIQALAEGAGSAGEQPSPVHSQPTASDHPDTSDPPASSSEKDRQKWRGADSSEMTISLAETEMAISEPAISSLGSVSEPPEEVPDAAAPEAGELLEPFEAAAEAAAVGSIATVGVPLQSTATSRPALEGDSLEDAPSHLSKKNPKKFNAAGANTL